MDINNISDQKEIYQIPRLDEVTEQTLQTSKELENSTTDSSLISPFGLFQQSYKKSLKIDSTVKDNQENSETVVETSLYERLDKARKNPLHWPPVIYAIEQKDYELLKFFIDMGEDLEKPTPNAPVYLEYETYSLSTHWTKLNGYQPGFRPLEYAITKNDVEAVRCLLEYCPKENRPKVDLTRTWYTQFGNDQNEYKIKIFGKNKDGCKNYVPPKIEESSWEMANRLHCQPEILRLILQNHPTLDARKIADAQQTSGNLNALTAAIQVMYYNWKGELINLDPEILDAFMKSSLQEAFQNGDEKLISLYIDYGWQMHSEDILKINNPLLVDKVLSGNISALEALEALILIGADWDKVENLVTKLDDLQKAFMVAVRLDSPRLAKFLLSLNIKPSIIYLNEAIKSGSDEMALLLINHGMGVADKMNETNKWLLSAVVHGRKKVVNELLSLGLFTEEGRLTAQKKAYELQKNDILDLLIQAKSSQ
jgi:ankyrin repeat protein